MLDAFIENANKNEAVETAPSADTQDTQDSQKTGVFRRSDPLTCKNPPKSEFTSKAPAYETAPTRIVCNRATGDALIKMAQKNQLAHMATLATLAD